MDGNIFFYFIWVGKKKKGGGGDNKNCQSRSIFRKYLYNVSYEYICIKKNPGDFIKYFNYDEHNSPSSLPM